MASPKSKHTNKSYLCAHIVETISTEKYTIMCGGHVPVHLFPSATDASFRYMIRLGPPNTQFSQKYYSIFRRKTPTIRRQKRFRAHDVEKRFEMRQASVKFSLTTPPARSGCQSLSRSVVYVEKYVHVRGEMAHNLTSFLHGEKKYKNCSIVNSRGTPIRWCAKALNCLTKNCRLKDLFPCHETTRKAIIIKFILL